MLYTVSLAFPDKCTGQLCPWTADMAVLYFAICYNVFCGLLLKMNMEIVVEGVESREMAQKLTQLGCDYLQGYYFSKPLPVNKFIECISKNPIFLFDKE